MLSNRYDNMSLTPTNNMAQYQLTEAMIRNSFEKTRVDKKYFPIYDNIAKRFFEDLSNEGSGQDVQTEDDNYAVSSLNLADEYIYYYVREAEKGHCEQWCETIADKAGNDYWAYHDAYDFIDDEEEKERELSIHANSLSEDPVFVERYIYLFRDLEENSYEMAEEYSKAFHKCIDNGKSQYYAQGYAYAVSENHYLELFCQIFAEAYEAAKEHGKIDAEAISFGEFCTDAYDHGLFLSLGDYLKQYHEDWQIEFYSKMICEDEEQDRNRALTEIEKNEIQEEIRWRLSQMKRNNSEL